MRLKKSATPRKPKKSKKTSTKNKPYSKIGLEFCEKLYKGISDLYSNVYYGENEFTFQFKGYKVIKPDFYIPELKLIIEFNGTYYHRDEREYNDKDDVISEAIRKREERRLKILRESFGMEVIIIWEKDYKKNKKDMIEKLIAYIRKKNKA